MNRNTVKSTRIYAVHPFWDSKLNINSEYPSINLMFKLKNFMK